MVVGSIQHWTKSKLLYWSTYQPVLKLNRSTWIGWCAKQTNTDQGQGKRTRIRHLRSRSLGRVGVVDFYFEFDGSASFFRMPPLFSFLGMPPLLPLCPFPSSGRCTSLPLPRQFVFLNVALPPRSITDLLQMHFIQRPGKSLKDKSHGHWGLPTSGEWGHEMKYQIEQKGEWTTAVSRQRNGFGGYPPITNGKEKR